MHVLLHSVPPTLQQATTDPRLCWRLVDPRRQVWYVHKSQNVAAAAAKSLQSCPTLCDPIDGSSTDSSVPGILQARVLEWVAISFSNA